MGRVPSSHLDTPGGTPVIVSAVIVYAVIDLRSSPDHPLGDTVETFLRREDAERSIAEVRGDDPDLTSYLRIEERELEAGGRSLSLAGRCEPERRRSPSALGRGGGRCSASPRAVRGISSDGWDDDPDRQRRACGVGR